MNVLVDLGMQWFSALRSTLDDADRRLKRRKCRVRLMREVQQAGSSLYDDFLHDADVFSEAFVQLFIQVVHDLELCCGQKIRYRVACEQLPQGKGNILKVLFLEGDHEIRLCWSLLRAPNNCRVLLTDLKAKEDTTPLWYSDEISVKTTEEMPFFDTSCFMSCKEKIVASLFPYFAKDLREIIDFKGSQHLEIPENYPGDALFLLRYRLERGLYMDLSESKKGLRLAFSSDTATSPDFGKTGEGVLFDSGHVLHMRGLRSFYDQFIFAISVARSRFITSIKRHRFINESKFVCRIEAGSVKFVFPSLRDGFRFLVLDVSEHQIQARFFSTDSRFTMVDIPMPEKRRPGRPFPSDKFSLELARILRKLIGAELSLEQSTSSPRHLLQAVLGSALTTGEHDAEAGTVREQAMTKDDTKTIAYDNRAEVTLEDFFVQHSLRDPVGLFLQQTYGAEGLLTSSLSQENDDLSGEFAIAGPHAARVNIHWSWDKSAQQLRSRVQVFKDDQVVLDEELTQARDVVAVSRLLAKVKCALAVRGPQEGVFSHGHVD